jgi:proteic killer suppression protein
MNTGPILYSSGFVKQFKNLPTSIQKTAIKKEALFRENPIHPSLRLHNLKGKLLGLYSLSITLNYRIIFRRESNGDIIFISIGKHDLYKSL